MPNTAQWTTLGPVRTHRQNSSVRGGLGPYGQAPKLDKISSKSLKSTAPEPSKSSGQPVQCPQTESSCSKSLKPTTPDPSKSTVRLAFGRHLAAQPAFRKP